MVTLFVMVLQITPAQASGLVIWVSLAAVAGRFCCSWMSDAMGRRASGVVSCLIAAGFMSAAGYLHNVFIGGVSMFFVMIVLQSFMGSGNYSIVGPYMGELWPARLRGSGMGLVYGVGNLGKFIGPAGLALIAGSSNFVAPKATLDALIPAFNYFAFWYVLGAARVLVHRHRDERPHDRGDRCGTDRSGPGGGVQPGSGEVTAGRCAARSYANKRAGGGAGPILCRISLPSQNPAWRNVVPGFRAGPVRLPWPIRSPPTSSSMVSSSLVPRTSASITAGSVGNVTAWKHALFCGVTPPSWRICAAATTALRMKSSAWAIASGEGGGADPRPPPVALRPG